MEQQIAKLRSLSSVYEGIREVGDLVQAIDAHNCTPGWVSRKQPLFWATPLSKFTPVHWSYREIRPALVAAGRVIGTDLAERRNFVLRNPVEGNDFATTRSLVGAYQSILPGERARSHRHSAHALRVIIESRGSYSIVNGKQHPMESGDIVLTPGNHWHGHGHNGDEQAFWFDCLDLPLVHLLEPMRFEEHPRQWEDNNEIVEHSPMRIEWSYIQEKLSEARSNVTPDASFVGTTVDFTSAAMPTITIKVHKWQAGWEGKVYRQNANVIYVVLRGKGCSAVGNQQFNWDFGDVFAVPLGVRAQHTASSDAVLVALSDEGLMKFSGYYSLEACE